MIASVSAQGHNQGLGSRQDGGSIKNRVNFWYSNAITERIKEKEVSCHWTIKKSLVVGKCSIIHSKNNSFQQMHWWYIQTMEYYSVLKRKWACKPQKVLEERHEGNLNAYYYMADIFSGSKITADGDCSHELLFGRKAMTNLDSILKSRDITLPTKVKAMVFPVVMYGMWELDYKQSWAPKNWCFWTVVLEKTLESPLDCKGIQPVHPKGDQSWIFIGRTDAEAETPIFRPPDAKNWLTGKDSDAGKDWRWEKGTTEDEMIGWHHRRDEHELE